MLLLFSDEVESIKFKTVSAESSIHIGLVYLDRVQDHLKNLESKVQRTMIYEQHIVKVNLMVKLSEKGPFMYL